MKRVIDEATKKKLVGLLPFAPGSNIPFTPEHLQTLPQEIRPVFFIRPFGEDARMIITKAIAGGEDGVPKTTVVDALNMGALVSWSNVIDAVTMEEIPFTKEAIPSIVDWPDKIVFGLYYEISKITSGPTEVEKEALQSLPPLEPVPLNNPVQSADASPA